MGVHDGGRGTESAAVASVVECAAIGGEGSGGAGGDMDEMGREEDKQ